MSGGVVSSADNRWVKIARALRSRPGRDKQGAFLVEGARAASEALSSGHALACLVNASEHGRDSLVALLEQARSSSVEIVPVEALLFAALCETLSPQGAMVIVRDIVTPLGALIGAAPRLIVIADAVQDPGNLGTLLRIADGVGADAFVATSGSVDIYNGKVVRASMGSLFHLEIAKDAASAEVISMLCRKGYSIVAADPRGTNLHYEFRYQAPLAVVFGNEGAGLSPSWRDTAQLVRIPLWGRAESLNVSVAAGVLLYEIIRQWQGSLVVPATSPVV
ncbi:MAG: 23S rRNA (uridine(2479)-2'-O)-methyltransferase [Firmicutes bacterium]|nr:23S rRNA (uridine(2479)-2'-O)-methyltransferase [Bacillota bacterium]